MWDDAVHKVQAIINESQKTSSWIPFGLDGPPELLAAKSEHEEIAIMFAGNLFISHSSYDSTFIDQFIVPSVRAAVGKRYFLLNYPLYSAFRDGPFQHALWVNAAMEACKTVILVVSKRSVTSDWFKWECHAAQSQKHPVIICQIDETSGTLNFVESLASKTVLAKKLNFHFQPRSSSRQLLKLLRSPLFFPGAWNGRPLGTPRFLLHNAGDDV